MRAILSVVLAFLVLLGAPVLAEHEMTTEDLLREITVAVIFPEVNNSPVSRSEVQEGFQGLLETGLQRAGFTVLVFSDRELEKAYKEGTINADLIVRSTVSFETSERQTYRGSSRVRAKFIDRALTQVQVLSPVLDADYYTIVMGIEDKERVGVEQRDANYSRLQPALSTLTSRAAEAIAAKVIEDLLGSAPTPPCH